MRGLGDADSRKTRERHDQISGNPTGRDGDRHADAGPYQSYQPTCRASGRREKEKNVKSARAQPCAAPGRFWLESEARTNQVEATRNGNGSDSGRIE
jgi:hypothetical protein